MTTKPKLTKHNLKTHWLGLGNLFVLYVLDSPACFSKSKPKYLPFVSASYEANPDLSEYKSTILVGDQRLRIFGTDANLVRVSWPRKFPHPKALTFHNFTLAKIPYKANHTRILCTNLSSPMKHLSFINNILCELEALSELLLWNNLTS